MIDDYDNQKACDAIIHTDTIHVVKAKGARMNPGLWTQRLCINSYIHVVAVVVSNNYFSILLESVSINQLIYTVYLVSGDPQEPCTLM